MTTGSDRMTRGAWGVGSALYLATQAPPALAGAVLLLLVALSAFTPRSIPTPTGGHRRLARAADLSPASMLLLAAMLGLLVLIQAVALPNELKPFTALHLALYVMVALARRESTPSWPAVGLVRWVSVLNLLLLPSLFIPTLADVLWYENVGQFRFQSIYFEPSIAALVYVLNLLILWRHGERGSRELPYVVCNLLCLALTYSGSGFLALAVVALFEFRRLRARTILAYLLLLAPAAILWLASEGGGEAIQQMIVGRAAGIVALDYDNSIHLRVVAPLLFLSELADGSVNAWLGAGVGGIESFMALRESALWFMTDFKGDPVLYINNGYIVAAALFGIPIACLLIAAWALYVLFAQAPASLKAFALLYPLVSGFVIHPLLWLLVVMIGRQRNTRSTDTAVGKAACTSPS
jgi:hypothetical protein